MSGGTKKNTINALVCSVIYSQARSQPLFSGKPEGPFCLSCTFIFRNERNWMEKSAGVSEKLVSPGLPGLQVATRLTRILTTETCQILIFFQFCYNGLKLLTKTSVVISIQGKSLELTLGN